MQVQIQTILLAEPIQIMMISISPRKRYICLQTVLTQSFKRWTWRNIVVLTKAMKYWYCIIHTVHIRTNFAIISLLQIWNCVILLPIHAGSNNKFSCFVGAEHSSNKLLQKMTTCLLVCICLNAGSHSPSTWLYHYFHNNNGLQFTVLVQSHCFDQLSFRLQLVSTNKL